MRVRDLRIGSKVQDESGFIFDVVSIHDCGTIYCDFEGNEGGVWEFDHNNPCVGIELTEEILLKCGFENVENFKTNKVFSKNRLYLTKWIDKDFFIADWNYKKIKNIQHLHQLQNLYYALCNEELNVKL